MSEEEQRYDHSSNVTRMCAHLSIERGVKKALKERANQVLTMHARYFIKWEAAQFLAIPMHRVFEIT